MKVVSPAKGLLLAGAITCLFLQLQSAAGASVKKNKETTSCTCGETNSAAAKIVNGQETEPYKYEWMLSLQRWNWHICGASIIGRSYALTAAHCVKFQGVTKSQLSLVSGIHNKFEAGIKHYIRRLHAHPDYDRLTTDNDIAVLEIRGDFVFSPVCLPPAPVQNFNNVPMLIMGWGTTMYEGVSSDVLLEAMVNAMPNSRCTNNVEFFYPSNYITNNMFCASEYETDSCQGDSGGPALWKVSNYEKYIQFGIVSWGYECANSVYPGVYTNLGNYLDFIESKLQDQFCVPSDVDLTSNFQL